VTENAFPSIVSSKQWEQAFKKVQNETRHYENEEMLEALRKLYLKRGKLTQKIINYSKEVPSVQAYINHFGGINEAYKLVGCPLNHDLSFLHAIRLSRGLREGVCDEICQRVREVGGTARKTSIHGLLILNGNIKVRVTVRKGWFQGGRVLAQLPLYERIAADVLVVGRLKPPDESVYDYFVIPTYSQIRGGIRVKLQENAPYLELYHHKTLNSFIETFRRIHLREAA
jgi:hypothetical protein